MSLNLSDLGLSKKGCDPTIRSLTNYDGDPEDKNEFIFLPGGKTKLRFVASDAISFSSLLIWLLSAGETRELLFLSNVMVFIADAEFLLLYEESRSDNLDFPNENFQCFLCRTKMEPSVQPI